MRVGARQTHTRYGDVALPGASRKSVACAGAVSPSVHTTGSSCTQADPSWAHTFRDQVAAELFPFWRTRANALAECGRGAVAIACKPCGAPHYVPVRCGSRTCPTCARKAAAAIAGRTAARIAVHDLIMESTPWDGPGRKQRRSWRLVTLTCPATTCLEDRYDHKALRRQVKRVRRAFGRFWRLTAWGRQVRSPGDRSKRSRIDTSYVLAEEASPRLMIHLHVAVFGEYIPQKQLQAAWGQALGVSAPVIDVRAVRGGAAGVAGALKEVLKYTCKGEKGPRQAAHAAAVELAFRSVRRVEIGGALRKIKLPESSGDTEDVKAEDLHATHAASCESCGSVGAWRWLGTVPASVVQENGGFGLAIDYRPPPEIRPNRIVQSRLPVARGVEFVYR